ncbi:ABC transporter permease subunit [Arthrobacter sp. I2-34]|uniref:ABC transporter permease subunit n=1 Tax=Arthrobacter hankyongi TaxID=2904801 RepID=A0ABS9L8M1_9MICC|nr:ABC transporter permease subunit [Arthrobacter hankyongi]MCG2623019.1 ABC transporter permease subunit [Arthrobacter hankyongi]
MRTPKKPSVGWAAIPPTLFLLLFFILPLFYMVRQSLWLPELTAEKYAESVTNPAYTGGLKNSLVLALYATLYTTVLGLFLVYAMDRWGKKWQAVISIFLLIPLVTNGELVRVLAWMIGLSPTGPITAGARFLGFLDPGQGLAPGLGAVVLGLVHILLPFFVFVVYSTTRGSDARIEQAAVLMGANRFQAFLYAVLPAAVPGILAGMLLAFMMTLGYYATPALLGNPQDTVLPVLIANQIKLLGDYGQAAALGMLLLGVILLFLFALNRLGVMQSLYGAPAHRDAARTGQSRLSLYWCTLVCSSPVQRVTSFISGTRAFTWAGYVLSRTTVVLLLVFLTIPLVISLGASFTTTELLTFPPQGFSLRWYKTFLSDQVWTTSALNSLLIALISAVVSVVFGALAAAALTRGKFKGKGALFALLIAPLVIPWIVPALGLYFESVSLGVAFTYAGISIGHVVLALPYSTLVISTALRGFDWRLDLAARMSGASLGRRIIDIYIPLLRPAMFSAFLFSFLTSFTEFVFAFFMSDVRLKTLPVQMWEGLTFNVTPTVAAAGGIFTALALAAMMAAGIWQFLSARRLTAQTIGNTKTVPFPDRPRDGGMQEHAPEQPALRSS